VVRAFVIKKNRNKLLNAYKFVSGNSAILGKLIIDFLKAGLKKYFLCLGCFSLLLNCSSLVFHNSRNIFKVFVNCCLRFLLQHIIIILLLLWLRVVRYWVNVPLCLSVLYIALRTVPEINAVSSDTCLPSTVL